MAKITCHPFDEKDANSWDEFVEHSNNGTLFHRRRFLGYHPEGRFRDASLVLKEKDKWAACFPACLIEEGGRKVLFSHRGATFGGFVVEEASSFREAFGLVEALLMHAKSAGIHRIVLTPSPHIYQTRLSDNLTFAMIQKGFTYLKQEVSSVLSLDPEMETNLRRFKPEARTAYRRAEKLGVEVRRSEDFATFYHILEQNLRLRHNVRPTHTLEELERLHSLFPERILLQAAFVEDRMIAGVVIFTCNPRALMAFYISHDDDYQQYRAVNLLFHDIIKEAISRGFHYLDFGIFTVDMKPNWDLGRFKESFGAGGVLRDTLQIDL